MIYRLSLPTFRWSLNHVTLFPGIAHRTQILQSSAKWRKYWLSVTCVAANELTYIVTRSSLSSSSRLGHREACRRISALLLSSHQSACLTVDSGCWDWRKRALLSRFIWLRRRAGRRQRCVQIITYLASFWLTFIVLSDTERSFVCQTDVDASWHSVQLLCSFDMMYADETLASFSHYFVIFQ